MGKEMKLGDVFSYVCEHHPTKHIDFLRPIDGSDEKIRLTPAISSIDVDEPVLGIYTSYGLFRRQLRNLAEYCGQERDNTRTIDIAKALKQQKLFHHNTVQIILQYTEGESKQWQKERSDALLELVQQRQKEYEYSLSQNVEYYKKIRDLGWMRFSEAANLIEKTIPGIETVVKRAMNILESDEDLIVQVGCKEYPKPDELVQGYYISGKFPNDWTKEPWEIKNSVVILADREARFTLHENAQKAFQNEEEWRNIPFSDAMRKIDDLRNLTGENEHTLPTLIRRDYQNKEGHLRVGFEESLNGQFYPRPDEKVTVSFAIAGDLLEGRYDEYDSSPLIYFGEPKKDLILITCENTRNMLENNHIVHEKKIFDSLPKVQEHNLRRICR